MGPEDVRDLNPHTTEILAALASMSMEDTIVEDDLEPLLARFVCGWVTDTENEAAITALTESSGYRIRLLEMRDSMKLAMANPDTRLQLSEREPLVAETLNSALASLIKVCAHWKDNCQKAFAMSNLSNEENRSIGFMLRQIGAGLRQQPVSVAVTRGDVAGSFVRIEPGQNQAELTVEIHPDRSLEATAILNSPVIDLSEVSLYLIGDEGDWVYLGTAPINGTRLEFKVDHCVEMLGLPLGALKTTWFTLTEGRTLPSRKMIRVQRPEEFAQEGSVSPIWLKLTRAPFVSSGVFKVGIELPDSIRARFANESISAYIDLGGYPLTIGRWPIADMSNSDEIVLSTPLAGLEDCEIELQSAISFSLHRSQ